MTPALENLQAILKKLPGLGYRSAERVALHLLLEEPETLPKLVEALESAAAQTRRCTRCGHIAETELCSICLDDKRDQSTICIVERIPDLIAMERSGAYRGCYHVLHGKLSPVLGVGPEHLNLKSLADRLQSDEVDEVVLALSNDVEGEATCHFLTEEVFAQNPALRVSRIGFGLPSGGGVLYADSVTLQSALEARRKYS